MQLQVSGPNVIRENFEGEVVIVHLETGHYYSLEGTAGDIWTWVEQGASRAEIAGEASRVWQLPVDAAEGIDGFLTGLVEENLARETEGSGGRDGQLSAPRTSVYRTPVLAKFSDMQELLLLDPIHETDEQGWPLTAHGRG